MHWRNSEFQIKYFLAGACHTPDEVYRKLVELKEERVTAVGSAEAGLLRDKAKLLRAERKLKSDDELDRLEAEAAIAQRKVFLAQTQACYDEAKREIEYLDKLIAEVTPYRKYAHLPDHEAFQLAQQEEWLEELKFRAENFIITMGTIPYDQFAAMRMHPQFDSNIVPHINELNTRLKQGELGMSQKTALIGW